MNLFLIFETFCNDSDCDRKKINNLFSIVKKVNVDRLTIVRIYSGDLAGTPVPAQIIAGMTFF